MVFDKEEVNSALREIQSTRKRSVMRAAKRLGIEAFHRTETGRETLRWLEDRDVLRLRDEINRTKEMFTCTTVR
jgi:ribosomal protein S25